MSIASETRKLQIDRLKKYTKSCEDSTSALTSLMSTGSGGSSDLLKIRNGLRVLIKESKSNRQALKEADIMTIGAGMNLSVTRTQKHDDALHEKLALYRDSVLGVLKERKGDGYGPEGASHWVTESLHIDLTDTFAGAHLAIHGSRHGAPIEYDKMIDIIEESGLISYSDSARDSAESTSMDDALDGEGSSSGGGSESAPPPDVESSVGTTAKIICTLATGHGLICNFVGRLIDHIIDNAPGKNRCKGKVGRCMCACEREACDEGMISDGNPSLEEESGMTRAECAAAVRLCKNGCWGT